MKKIFLIVTIGLLFLTTGCDNVLDTKPGDTYSEDDLYNNIDLTERLLFYSYGCTQTWGINLTVWWGRCVNIEDACDEGYFHFKTVRYTLFPQTNGSMTPSNFGVFNGLWKNYYSYIGTCNLFLSKIDDSSVMTTDHEKATQLKGEAKFLRAYCYACLIQYFGGVPLLEEPFNLDSDFNVERSSYESCVDFISKELTEAASLLPEYASGKDFGRADKRAALAIKSRVLLYAASKLHDPDTVPNGPMYDYTKASKWQDAADAAKAVIDLPSNADGLIQVKDYVDYQNLFIHPNKNILFARPFNSDFATYATDLFTLPDQAQSPNGYNGWGLSNPTQNFIDLFKMNNGKSINEEGSGYKDDVDNIYKNRDLRFYADIIYNGASFRGRNSEFFRYGFDSKDIGDMSKHFNVTGYNIRKFQDESIDFNTTMSPDRPYIISRLAEIYLNYAEAMYHLGKEDIAREYVSKVAMRAKQPAITSTGEKLLQDIKNERSIELCFEGHRYFDLRRWMDEDHLGGDIKGVSFAYYKNNEIVGKDKATGLIPSDAKLVMTKIPKIENRPWQVQFYYLPIPQKEIIKNDLLEQNYGYK